MLLNILAAFDDHGFWYWRFVIISHFAFLILTIFLEYGFFPNLNSVDYLITTQSKEEIRENFGQVFEEHEVNQLIEETIQSRFGTSSDNRNTRISWEITKGLPHLLLVIPLASISNYDTLYFYFVYFSTKGSIDPMKTRKVKFHEMCQTFFYTFMGILGVTLNLGKNRSKFIKFGCGVSITALFSCGFCYLFKTIHFVPWI
jgi:hypothetical protein